METFFPYFLTGIISFTVGFLLKHVYPKAKVVWWSSHSFWFNVPEGDRIITIFTHAITIQNLGRKPAENIEIIHKAKPDHFKLEPPLNYQEDQTPSGEHIIRISNLSSKSFFTIEFLSYLSLPELLYIHSKDGEAKSIRIQPQQVLSKNWKAFAQLMYWIGLCFTFYWLIRAIIFVSQNVF